MKFIKRIIKYFKNIFLVLKNKLNRKDNVEPVNTIKHEITVDNALEKRKEEFENIKIKDIIWAKRYETEEEKEKIPEGHREGPHLVVDKQGNKLYCLYGTSVVPTFEKEKFFYNDTYILNNKEKTTYFNTYFIHIIDINRFIEKKSELPEEKMNEIFSLMKKVPNLKKYNGDKIKINFPIEVGDIISKTNNFLVIDKKGDKLRCLLLNKSVQYLKEKFNLNDFEGLEYSNVIEITSKDVTYINHLDSNLLTHILKKQKEHLENLKLPSRGSVIIKDAKKYYIYGEEGQELMAFQIWKKNKGEDIALNINKKTFYTDFNNLIRINKKDRFEIQLLATEDEMINIRETKKSYFKTKKQEVKNSNNVSDNVLYQFGLTVKLDKDSFIEYAVIGYDKKRDMVHCICLNEINVRPLKKYYFPVDSIKWVEHCTKERLQKNKARLKRIMYGR